jgi:hypothetical protein
MSYTFGCIVILIIKYIATSLDITTAFIHFIPYIIRHMHFGTYFCVILVKTCATLFKCKRTQEGDRNNYFFYPPVLGLITISPNIYKYVIRTTHIRYFDASVVGIFLRA